MGMYDAAATKGAPATGTAIAVLTVPSGSGTIVKEIGIFQSTAVATSIGIIRTLTTGTTSTTQLTTPEHPSNPAGVTTLATAWSVQPTISGTPLWMRRIILPATIGAGIIWQFDNPGITLLNGATTGLAIWNWGAGTGAALEVYVRTDE